MANHTTGNNRAVSSRRYGRLNGLDRLQPNVDPVRIYEARIAIQLAGGSAIFCENQRVLYFHDSSDKGIDEAIATVMQGLGRSLRSKPVGIDCVGYFRVARKIPLSDELYPAVVAALRLLGVEIKRIRMDDHSLPSGIQRPSTKPLTTP